MSDDDDGGPFGYWPLGGAFMIWLLVLAVAAILFVSVAGYAYERMGISEGWFDGLLIGSILGSRINIPVWKFKGEPSVQAQDVVVFGIRYRVPAVRDSGTILAVNVGGAIIPTGLSAYLIVHDHIWEHALIAVAIVSVIMALVARPVQGVGVVTPVLIPPLAAGITALLIGRPDVAALAYVCGTLGALIGADLFNLPRIKDMGAPEASIGGAGTFDGIFLSGLLAVVIASL